MKKKHASAADIVACRDLLRCGSRSFYAASFLLPQRFRDPAMALYAFCRIADDAIDCVGDDPVLQAEALAMLHDRLDRIYDGRPIDDPADRALADVVVDFAMPKRLLEALLEGFEWDAEGRRYEDISGVYSYSARVAGTVGAMMAALMGARSEELVARACDLGVAMQITNICRDVGEDARNGRLYLPRDWMREAGIDPDVWLEKPVFNDALAAVIRRMLETADRLYQRSDAGIAGLPMGCRAGINAARYLYAEIGRQVERQGLDSISQRAVVPPQRKLQLLAPILGKAMLPSRSVADSVLEETRFLVDAVVAETPQPESKPASSGVSGNRVMWVLELFEQMEERERAVSLR
ncbi:phytoene/squalene synthase family protein [Thiorhodococcus mannitoliphagus]|uniref:Phytoene/squalene synthase family protein n=1 Tax=Thiorhodococcus mannitoliphagus TaxID=329406 RepID=A0A6P1DRN2_9GAMM|nr:phytoene/squalene synthase family protein [Thiorhodococcus mannitoliphagus]NEX20917.1 phytoene/squalene synthase family protein [Thiorhodococcus mannitoliphagus]